MGSGDTKTEQLLYILEHGGDTTGISGCCNTKLQNYLMDSINSVGDAKDVIVEKGGSVGDTGLAGLADEIDTIPTGGGGAEDWGTVTYLVNGEEVTGTIQNSDEFMSLGQYGLNVYNPATIDGVTVPINSIKNVTFGKSATFTPHFFLNQNNRSDLTLSNTKNLTVLLSGFLYQNTNFNANLSLPNVACIEDNFLSGCINFNKEILLPQVKYIGGNFLYGCHAFDQTVSIPKVQYIGTSFMFDCRDFKQSLTIPASISSITTSFMGECKAFVGPLVCNGPSVSSTINNNKANLATADATAAMYVTGVTLTGPHANDWKTRLGDRAVSPYRKLIVSA